MTSTDNFNKVPKKALEHLALLAPPNSLPSPGKVLVAVLAAVSFSAL